jgi:hypothetical protein
LIKKNPSEWRVLDWLKSSFAARLAIGILRLLLTKWIAGIHMRSWLVKNEIFFKTIAAALLSIAAVYISFMQYQSAQEQSKQQRREGAIAKARDWAALRELLRPILNKYPSDDVHDPALKNISKEEKLKWLSEMESLVIPLGANSILIGSRHNYERYLAMLGDLDSARNVVLHTNDQNNIFYQVTVRVGLHAIAMWVDLQMMRGGRDPEDKLYQPTTPEESIFARGFPWETDLRNDAGKLKAP